ncbi:MAG: ribosome small subunit-dependent GTPase A [Tenericutes bacterium]|mgnify:FL=1|nr:ribosome small subunit-dependent GTPase A [Mycoplasmatota bacterium]
MIGRVIKLISNKWTVDIEGHLYECSSIGKFKYLKLSPKVGDLVEVDIDNNIIKKIMPRKNELIRPPISNIDQAIILVSCKEPSFSSNLLDKMLVVIEYNNVKPVICFTKYDLLSDTSEIDEIISYYKQIGYEVYINSNLDSIKSILSNKISVLTGQTGVGKSSLLNHLKADLNLATNEISKALGRGKHTTRHVELLSIEDGLVADTPGFSSLDFIGMNKNDIKDNFVEFFKNQDKCKYKDCLHIKEDGCYIKELVEEGKIRRTRYDNYKKFIESIENNMR